MRKILLGIVLLLFHLGWSLIVEGSNGPQEISAAMLIDQIRNGSSVPYNNIIFIEDLNLTDADLLIVGSPKVIDSPIVITDSVFKGDFIIENCELKNILSLNNNTFLGNVSFNSSKLNEGASFTTSRFEKSALFKNITFLGDANFRGATFKGDLVFENTNSSDSWLSFYNTSFLNEVKFYGSELRGEGVVFVGAIFNGLTTLEDSDLVNSDFYSSRFNGPLMILNSVFNESANFGNATFNGDVAIYESTFNGRIDMTKSRFMQKASFKGSAFKGPAIFQKTEFENRAQFSETEFVGLADFTDCIFKENALFEGAAFKDNLLLKRTEYKNMFIRWENITRLQFDDTSFLLLVENFKSLGFWSDADECYYTYRSERSQFLPIHYKLVDRLLLILYGYGTKPELSLFWIFYVIILFSLFYFGSLKKDDLTASFSDAILFSAANFIYGTKSLSDFISPPTKFIVDERCQHLVIAEKFLGMLLFALFLISLARTVIR